MLVLYSFVPVTSPTTHTTVGFYLNLSFVSFSNVSLFMCVNVPVLGCVCLSASGFRSPWSWIEGGCEQPTWVWELAWLLCKSRQRSSLLSHFSSLPTSPFLFRQRSQPMERWATYVHLSASAKALETGTSKVMYHPGHSKPKQVDREEKLAGTAGYILAMGRNLV